MDPATIALLIQTLGPIIIPILSNVFTWLFNKSLGSLSPSTQAIVNPFLPLIAGGIGTALGTIGGSGPLAGVVGGLAATGLHQAISQPVKASKMTAGEKNMVTERAK